MTFDFEKKVFLDELENYMNSILIALETKDIGTFEDTMNKIAYLSLIKKEY